MQGRHINGTLNGEYMFDLLDREEVLERACVVDEGGHDNRTNL
jgi:hypothetical protein